MPSLGNPNVHLALANSLIACGGGTALAVVIGLTALVALAVTLARTVDLSDEHRTVLAAVGMVVSKMRGFHSGSPWFIHPACWAIAG